MNPEIIKKLIEQDMPSASVAVSGGEGKYVAEVTSEAFEGLMLIKRHKLLHALTIIAKTPAELANA
jgi:acid stress-induced BolA-like protein IbaG/YrbA